MLGVLYASACLCLALVSVWMGFLSSPRALSGAGRHVFLCLALHLTEQVFFPRSPNRAFSGRSVTQAANAVSVLGSQEQV